MLNPEHRISTITFFCVLVGLSILLIHANLYGQKSDIKFKHLSLEQGLSQTDISCILQDSKGFIWFGTQDGLNKYDGYGFTVYQNDPSDSTSLSDSDVLCIFEDRYGYLWIGTKGGGLNRFDRTSDTFRRWKNNPKNPNSLSHNIILSICEDSSDVLWIGTAGGGLNRFDREKERFTHYRHDPDNPNSISNNYVVSIHIDSSGVIWIGTWGRGLNRYDPNNETFKHWIHDSDDRTSISSNNIACINEFHTDSQNVMLIGTAAGVNKFNQETEQFTHYRNNPNDPLSLSNDYISSILRDKSGTFWIGTYGGGLNRWNQKHDTFEHWEYIPDNPEGLNNNQITKLYEDRSGVIWIGTMGGGINRFNRTRKAFRHWEHDSKNSASLSHDDIFSIYEDPAGDIWIGTYGGGLILFHQAEETFERWVHEPGNPHSLGNNDIFSIYNDISGTFWIGTGNGLFQFDRENNRFQRQNIIQDDTNQLIIFSIIQDNVGAIWIGTYGNGIYRLYDDKIRHYKHNPDDPNSLSDNFVKIIYEDRNGILWIGTDMGGLNRYDPETGRFSHWLHDTKNPESLSHDEIYCIYEDNSGLLWIGTDGGGLNRFNREKNIFIRITEKDGLPGNVVYGIIEDAHGNLWLSTNRGISKCNPKTTSFRNYDVYDGLQSNEFNQGAYCKTRTGEMFFGGINGFNAFHPDSIKDNPHIPPIVFTDFQISNRSVSIGGDFSLQQHISEAKEIILSHKDKVFSFTFAALDYQIPEKNQYMHIMEGFDPVWSYTGYQRTVTYTNLSPGEYIFRVRGSNNDGVWNQEGASIKITIIPPFWRTLWFMAIAIFATASLVYGLHGYRIRLLRIRAKIMEREVKKHTDHLTKEIAERKIAEEKIKASLEEKVVLLQEIHHRVKNNLQVICSLLNLQSKTVKEKEALKILRESQSRIRTISLVHEKLYQAHDLARINLIEYTKSLAVWLYQSYGVSPNRIILEINVGDISLAPDTAVPFGLVINELLSNALKHAFPKSQKKMGKILIDLTSDEAGNITLIVRDNGVGLPKDLDVHSTESLGLRLVTILVEDQLQGKLHLDRRKGTAFHIEFNQQIGAS